MSFYNLLKVKQWSWGIPVIDWLGALRSIELLPHSRTICPWPFHIEQHLLERWCIGISIICDNAHALPERPILIIPPIVAPGAGSIFQIIRYYLNVMKPLHTGKKRKIPVKIPCTGLISLRLTNDSMYLFSLSVSLISTHVIPGWHTRSESDYLSRTLAQYSLC